MDLKCLLILIKKKLLANPGIKFKYLFYLAIKNFATFQLKIVPIKKYAIH